MITSVDLLVKPFSHSKDLPINRCEDMNVPPFAENPFLAVLDELDKRGITPDEYLQIVLKQWKERIDMAQATRERMLLVIDIFPDEESRPDVLLELRKYAKDKLKNRFASVHSGYESANYLAGRELLGKELRIEAYGEISNRCADGEKNDMVSTLRDLKPGLKIYSMLNDSLCPDQVEGKFEKVEKPVKSVFMKGEFIDEVISGKKTLELRIKFDSFDKVNVGDQILFKSSNKSVKVIITGKREYKDIESVIQSENVLKLAPGYSIPQIRNSAPRIFSAEDVATYGFVLFEFEKIH